MSPATPSGIIAVIRADTADAAHTIAVGLGEAGVDAVEITLTVPGALDVIERLAGAVGCAVGAGTVRTAEDAAAAVARGATFIVSPDFQPAVLAATAAAGAASVPGALTPSEVGRCLDAGADAVKIFPAGSLGGPAYIRTLSEPFPGVPWVVSGGIRAEQVAEYLALGAHAVCMGGALIDRAAAAAGDIAAIARHARPVLLAARS